MNSENGASPETEKKEIQIGFDGEKFTVIVPLSAGKIAAYGAFQMALELASRVYWGIEKKEAEESAKSKSILSKLHIPGVRTH